MTEPMTEPPKHNFWLAFGIILLITIFIAIPNAFFNFLGETEKLIGAIGMLLLMAWIATEWGNMYRYDKWKKEQAKKELELPPEPPSPPEKKRRGYVGSND